MSEQLPQIGIPSPNEPAVTDPQLRALVEAARWTSPPSLTVTAEAIHQGWQQRRARRRRNVGLLAAAGLATLVVGTLYGTSRPGTDAREDGLVAQVSDDTRDAAQSLRSGPAQESASPEERGSVEGGKPADAPPTGLDAGIRVASVNAQPADYEVLGPRQLRVRGGALELEQAEGESKTEVLLPSGRLEIYSGVVRVEIAGDVARVDVVQGKVVRIEADGGRRVLTPTRSGSKSDHATKRASAADLAREAEQRLLRGDRSGAVAVLRRLVKRYPRSSAARTGLIDLGRLLTDTGRRDEARCAYELFLTRWPGHNLGRDVQRALRSLGEGPRCKGLRPQR